MFEAAEEVLTRLLARRRPKERRPCGEGTALPTVHTPNSGEE
ncbi:hypothetical protein ACFXPI_12225 [Streptomyces sp. NPDC059104]